MGVIQRWRKQVRDSHPVRPSFQSSHFHQTRVTHKKEKTVPLIRLDRVSKVFHPPGGQPSCVVNNLSLDVQSGEFLTILGASGSGKTTLLRLIAGLDTPTSGCITLMGRPLERVPAYRRPINMMFQSYALFPHLSVFDNVAFGLRQDGVSESQLNRLVMEGLELVKLTGFRQRRPDQLSGGQRQRVALARSLVKKPRLLLLDEPTAALDRALRERTRRELVHIQSHVGITFVVVTHDQEEALVMSSRIAVMSKGQVVQHGRPQNLYQRPENLTVARFFGRVNLWPATLIQKDQQNGMLIVRCPALNCSSIHIQRFEGSERLSVGQSVWLMVRPESFSVVHPSSMTTTLDGSRSQKIVPLSMMRGSQMDRADACNLIEGTLQRTAFMGDRTTFELECCPNHSDSRHSPTILCVSQPNGGFLMSDEQWIEKRIQVMIEPSRAHLIPRDPSDD